MQNQIRNEMINKENGTVNQVIQIQSKNKNFDIINHVLSIYIILFTK